MSEVTAAMIAGEDTPAPESEAPAEQVVAPVEPDATETVAEAETDEEKNARELAEQKDRSEKRARGIQKRLDELTADKYAERKRAEELAAQNAKLLEMVQGRAPQAQQAQTSGEPKREQFADYESWIEAKAEYRAEQKAQQLVESRFNDFQRQQQQAVIQQQASQIRAQFEARQAAYAKDHPEYLEDVQRDDVQIPNEAAAMLHTFEDAPAILHYFAKNPQAAQQLAGRSPLDQAVILGQIRASLAKPPQVSKAPAPGKPTGAKATAQGMPEDTEAYMQWRAKQRS